MHSATHIEASSKYRCRVLGGGKVACAVVIALGLALIANCVGPAVVNQLAVLGDENGGSIAHSLGSPGTQSAAYKMINEHCSKFGRRSFITQMDFEGGTMTFVCIRQNPTASRS
jgi:hypothetical protein